MAPIGGDESCAVYRGGSNPGHPTGDRTRNQSPACRVPILVFGVRGLGWVALGLVLLGFAYGVQSAMNPQSLLGGTNFGKWARLQGPMPTRPSRVASNGGQVVAVVGLFGLLSIAGGITAIVKRDRSGWEL